MRFPLFLMIAAASALAPAANVTNTVLMVDQRGSLNVEGVASVEQVATNAVKVQIAEAKAEAAQATARGVTNALQAVAENIMSNNVVIYRSGFSDSFAALVIISDNDYMAMTRAEWIEQTAARIVVEVDYICTANLGTIKPLVQVRNTLDGAGSRYNFDEVDEANVTTPVFHAGEMTVGGHTVSGYYSITVTILNLVSNASYFLWIKAEADTPSGDGTTLDLPNGVTGGITGDFTWGDKILSFEGGVLKGVADVE